MLLYQTIWATVRLHKFVIFVNDDRWHSRSKFFINHIYFHMWQYFCYEHELYFCPKSNPFKFCYNFFFGPCKHIFIIHNNVLNFGKYHINGMVFTNKELKLWFSITLCPVRYINAVLVQRFKRLPLRIRDVLGGFVQISRLYYLFSQV